MTCALSVPLEIIAVIHEIEGGGYWAEVPRFPGCIAQAESIEVLKKNIVRAVEDWLGPAVVTEEEARKLAEIQGRTEPFDQSFPRPNDFQPPASWNDDAVN